MTNESITERRDFARFNRINFPQFRYAIMLKLKVLRLENIVLGTEPRPHQVTKSALVLNIKLCVSSVASRTMLMWPVQLSLCCSEFKN
jgi:hypothetical protein